MPAASISRRCREFVRALAPSTPNLCAAEGQRNRRQLVDISHKQKKSIGAGDENERHIMTPVTPPGAIALRTPIRARSKDFVAKAGAPRPERNLDSKPANCAADHRMLMGHQNALRATVNRGSRFDALDLASLAPVALDGLESDQEPLGAPHVRLPRRRLLATPAGSARSACLLHTHLAHPSCAPGVLN